MILPVSNSERRKDEEIISEHRITVGTTVANVAWRL